MGQGVDRRAEVIWDVKAGNGVMVLIMDNVDMGSIGISSILKGSAWLGTYVIDIQPVLFTT